MGGLQRLEHKLEQVISGAFARAFRSAVQPVEIAAALQRECDNNAQILSRDRRLVPNDFHVELSQTDLDRLAPYDSALADDLGKQLRDHADHQSYVFPGPVSIAFEAAEDLTTGRFRIRSQAQAKVTGSSTHTQVGRARAVLEVNGTRHPLQPPGLVDRPRHRGRRPDQRPRREPPAHRVHGQRRRLDGLAIEVHDLGSTNGMLVDGHRISRTGLRDGSQVKIGSTTMTVRVVEGG